MLTADERRIRPAGRSATARHAAASRRALWESRAKYLAGAVCIAICAIMLAPLVAPVLASLKSTHGAGGDPADLLHAQLSLDSYAKLWSYQDGLPTYLFNSAATAVLAIVFSLGADDPRRLRARALSGARQGVSSSSSCCSL